MRKWFRITCSSLSCRWQGTRRAETKEQATARTCPRCGSDVLGVATIAPQLGTVLFRQDGTAGGNRPR